MENFDWYENEEDYWADVLADVTGPNQVESMNSFLFRI